MAPAATSLRSGNELAGRICEAIEELHLVDHREFPMSLPTPCVPGAPLTPALIGASLHAMLERRQCRQDAVHVEKWWRKGGENLN
jgi:hypothetical protein